jgi:hypothetical protein
VRTFSGTDRLGAIVVKDLAKSRAAASLSFKHCSCSVG